MRWSEIFWREVEPGFTSVKEIGDNCWVAIDHGSLYKDRLRVRGLRRDEQTVRPATPEEVARVLERAGQRRVLPGR